MIPMLYLKYNKSAAYRFYQEQTCRDRFSHTYNSSFYICNTETTIKKSRQTHFANNKKTSIVCTKLEKRSCYYAASHMPVK